ncbi:LysE family translocator [Sphingomonas sp. KR3-1]|uniref:LysE family translocator n=1 Tax=Sphingomonas sp. KR3-1 TaxID=3156611 RepID=UPI0032B61D3B
MTLQTWWLFVAAVFLLSGTPGPNMLHILSRSVDFGVRRTVLAMAGCLAGLVTILAASAAGLTALLLAIPGAFEVLRWLGTAYLVWLGIKAWRADPTPLDPGDDQALDRRLTPAQLFRAGYAISISNPKALLFAAAFFPQFVSAAAPKPPQFAILVLTFAVIECFWYMVYALGGRGLARHLAKPALKKGFNRLTGTIFIGFGLLLLRSRHA